MALIVSEVYDALLEAGASADKARAAAGAVPSAGNIATRDDIANMATKHDIANMATKHDIANMATKEDISHLEKRIAVLSFAILSLGPAILAFVVKLTFFP